MDVNLRDYDLPQPRRLSPVLFYVILIDLAIWILRSQHIGKK